MKAGNGNYAADLATLIDRVEVKANDTQDDDILQLVRIVRVALMQSFIDRISICANCPGRKATTNV